MDLRKQLSIVRHHYIRHRFFSGPSPLDYSVFPNTGRFAKWRTVVMGRVTWGVFARAYWAIYQPGVSQLFYGSVLLSHDVADESAPTLFEIAEYSRRVMEYDVPLEGIEEYAKVIRDDYSLPDKIEVPMEISTKRGVFLQSIAIPRTRLPGGYLHHRLVPVVCSPTTQFASIVPYYYWGEEFRAIWRAGDPLLSESEIASYRADSPDITP